MSSDLLQPGWREATLRVNGVDLHVVEAGNPDHPLLMLLHGFPESGGRDASRSGRSPPPTTM